MEKVILADSPLNRAGAVDFEALVQLHARFVFQVAFAVLRNAEDAEDVVQETFFRAYRSGQAGKVERIRSWLARICAVSLDQWKRLREIQRSQSNPAVTPAAAGNKATPKSEGSALSLEEPLYQIGGPGTDPVSIQKPAPGFTAEARAQRVEGSVLLEVVIGKDGVARSVKVLRGIGFGLDESAVETVTKRWLFRPATLNGQPVSVQAKIEVTFRQY